MSIERFLRSISKCGNNLHSLIICQNGEIVFEKYWAPFDANTPHRMYSVTKSFIATAIGFLIDEGKLKLSDKIVDFFPDKLPENVHPLLKKQTIEDMLTMRTVFTGMNWFKPGVVDRCAFYFNHPVEKPAGTVFHYDSTGSYIMGCLVERLSGLRPPEYLREKCLNDIGGFENAKMLSVADGTPWGDSALICTPRALLNFAKYVMAQSRIDGSFLQRATSRLSDTANDDRRTYDHFGYGYQFWKTELDGFSFNGMGGQFAVCVPSRDTIMVCTGDDQLAGHALSETLYRAFFDEICEVEGEEPNYELPTVRGNTFSPFIEKINGREYVCEQNPMGIARFCVNFDGDAGVFDYTNAQGRKQLRFGVGQNAFGQFPQYGYSDERGNVHDENSFTYRCAASAAWPLENLLRIRVQILDQYFGETVFTIGFTDDGDACVTMEKSAEDFLNEYQGVAIAKRAR